MENSEKKSSELCQTCGDMGFEDLMMTCFNCREVKEHIYCAKIRFRSVPYMWLCQVCRSSNHVLHIPKIVDNDSKVRSTDYCASKPDISSKFSVKNSCNHVEEEICKPDLHHGGTKLHLPSHELMLAHTYLDEGASLVSNDTAPNKKHQQQFLDFPPSKRKRRTLRLSEDAEKTKCQGPQRAY